MIELYNLGISEEELSAMIDIYEDIKRYIRYREDELELRELPSRMEGAEESIVETQEGLEEANINITIFNFNT